MNNEQEQNFTLDQVIENSFDFSGYDEEEKKDIIAETSGMIMETALLRALDSSDDETKKAFNDFIEQEPDENAMSDFINKHFPNFGELVLEEIKLFQETGEKEETTDTTDTTETEEKE